MWENNCCQICSEVSSSNVLVLSDPNPFQIADRLDIHFNWVDGQVGGQAIGEKREKLDTQ